ncbi:MAG: metal-dependent hydrolase, partial [Planctomycetes bacterium]|nr:metal-dependent hydrolase [Planctomycetota bacterium]
FVLRLNLFVTMLCGILPDLVDKPTSAFLETGGRYIGHTFLFVLLVAAAFFLWKKSYGLAALVGGMSHLIIDRFDSSGFVPWFFPFKDYDFPPQEFDWSEFYHDYISVSGLVEEVIWVAAAVVVAFISLWLWRWFGEKRKQKKDLTGPRIEGD